MQAEAMDKQNNIAKANCAYLPISQIIMTDFGYFYWIMMGHNLFTDVLGECHVCFTVSKCQICFSADNLITW